MNQIALFPELIAPSRDSLSFGAKRLLGLLKSFATVSGHAFPFQRTLARRFGVCCQTVRRWLHELVEWGYVTVQKRGRTSAEYHLSDAPFFQDDARSNARSNAPVSSYSERKQEQNIPPPPNEQYATRQECGQINMTAYDEPFQAYLGVFLAAGRPLNDEDAQLAHRLWRQMPIEERIAAGRHAIKMCVETVTEFLPLPVNHLRGKAWTRVAPPRTLPYRPPLGNSKFGRGLVNAMKILGINGEPE